MRFGISLTMKEPLLGGQRSMWCGMLVGHGESLLRKAIQHQEIKVWGGGLEACGFV